MSAGVSQNPAPSCLSPALQLKREWSPWPEFGSDPGNPRELGWCRPRKLPCRDLVTGLVTSLSRPSGNLHRIVSDDTKREMAGLSARACASRQAHRLVVESRRFPQDCEFQSNPSFHPACPFTSSRGEVPLSRTAHRRAVVPTAVRRWVTLRRGFAQWILVPLVALFWPWCPLQYWANCDCLMCSCVPCTALLDVAVHLLEEGLEPCCCRNN